MSDTDTAATPDPTPQQPDEVVQPGGLQGSVYLKELAEVYLLLDNLSGAPDKALSSDKERTPVGFGQDSNDTPIGDKDWVQAVCEIGWPPSKEKRSRAHDIATLLRVRDFLNRRAAPASGATIAFTLLVAGEGGPINTNAVKAVSLGDNRVQLSRTELAMEAYPGLDNTARRFRRTLWALAWGLLGWLVVTCCLSWNIAGGNALLAQLASAKADLSQAESQLLGSAKNDADASPPVDPTGASRPSGRASNDRARLFRATIALATSPPIHCPPATPDDPYGVLANTWPVQVVAADAVIDPASSLARQRLCGDEARANFAYKEADANLRDWARPWTWMLSKPLQGLQDFADWICQRRARPQTNDIDNEQWTTALLNVLTGAILPILYGLLGSAAAVARMLSAKMRGWLLAPRDLQLSIVQLALGAVIGACIGLFVPPTAATASASATPGLLGSVHLTSSALCFIAGFFVDGVFVALEGLMRRLFSIADPTAKPAN